MKLSLWMHRLSLGLVTGVIWLGAGVAPVCAVTGFFYLEGIPGEAKQKGHVNWIEVEHFQNGFARARLDDGSGFGGASFDEFEIRKGVDKASPLLLEALTKGEVIPNAKLELVVPGDQQVRYYQIALEDVLVTELMTANAGTGDLPVETVAFRFEKISWTYTEFDTTGNALAEHTVSWDLVLEQGGGSTVRLGFRVRAERLDDGQFRLGWKAVPGRQYQILGSDSLTGRYQPVESMTADGEDAEVLITPRRPMQFFLISEDVTADEGGTANRGE